MLSSWLPKALAGACQANSCSFAGIRDPEARCGGGDIETDDVLGFKVHDLTEMGLRNCSHCSAR